MIQNFHIWRSKIITFIQFSHKRLTVNPATNQTVRRQYVIKKNLLYGNLLLSPNYYFG